MSLIAAEQPEGASPDLQGRMRRVTVGAVVGASVLAVGWWGSSMHGAQPAAASVLQFEQKVQLAAGVVPEEALQRNEKRKRMVIEQDLKTTLEIHVRQSGRQAHYEEHTGDTPAKSCYERAQRLFDEVTDGSDMKDELEDDEFHGFKQRFATAMQQRCKDAISERLWIHAAGEELEQQKPLMTAALVSAINNADMGFQVEMQDWLKHESPATMPRFLGLLPSGPEDREDILRRPEEGKRTAEDLPDVFRAELKWPKCKNEILRIHNQGHCGSCWAFGGTASIDARMCIASDGAWNAKNDVLSRLHVVSCSTWPEHDGCMGGWPQWAMEMMAGEGIASTSCLPYYIKGEGTEHFHHKDAAPPCETHCQGGYSQPLTEDTFHSASIADYNVWRKVNWFPHKVGIMKAAIYHEGPVAFTFKVITPFIGYKTGVFSTCHWSEVANHAVYAFGWGVVAAADGGDAVEYIEGSNSWGEAWGDNGHFRIHPGCVHDVTIPGPIESTVVNHTLGVVDSSAPRDKENENWPWAPPEECPYSEKDGCITDLEGPEEDYSNFEKCVSDKLNGKRIVVKQFDLERTYDHITINGKMYSGNDKHGFEAKVEGEEAQGWEGVLDTFSILVDEKGIQFHADKSKTGTGFKICAVPDDDSEDDKSSEA